MIGKVPLLLEYYKNKRQNLVDRQSHYCKKYSYYYNRNGTKIWYETLDSVKELEDIKKERIILDNLKIILDAYFDSIERARSIKNTLLKELSLANPKISCVDHEKMAMDEINSMEVLLCDKYDKLVIRRK